MLARTGEASKQENQPFPSLPVCLSALLPPLHFVPRRQEMAIILPESLLPTRGCFVKRPHRCSNITGLLSLSLICLSALLMALLVAQLQLHRLQAHTHRRKQSM